MSVVLNGNTYETADFVGGDGRGYNEVFPATGLTLFPESIFTDMLAELVISNTRDVVLYITEAITDCAIGNGQIYFTIGPVLVGMNLIAVHAMNVTAGVTGTMDIQVHNVTTAADMLSTPITIDSGELGSDTADVPAVIDTAEDDVAENDLLRIDVDAVHTTAAKGLIVRLTFAMP